MEIKIKKIYDDSKFPVRAHETDAGMDLFLSSCYDEVVIAPGSKHLLPTGIKMEIPDGYVGLIWDKSGLSSRGLKVFGGVIDSSYRGEIIVSVLNFGKESILLKKGDKIAQMLIQKVEFPRLVEVDYLSDSDRGEEGFGSTGK